MNKERTTERDKCTRRDAGQENGVATIVLPDAVNMIMRSEDFRPSGQGIRNAL